MATPFQPTCKLRFVARERTVSRETFGGGNEKHGRSLADPMGTVVSRDRFGLVTVHGQPHYIADIGFRMLVPRELYRAQGFPESVQLRGTTRSQVALCGNSVSPPVAEAIVRANFS